MKALLIVIVGLSIVIPCAASTIYVKEGATGTGASWADAYGDLQDALNDAEAGDEIWVAAGTYKPTAEVGGTGDRYKTFQMRNGVTIKGGYAGWGAADPDERDVELHETILSGDLLGNDNPAIPIEEFRYDPSREDNCYHVFCHPEGTGLDATAVLDGFTITAGNTNVRGGRFGGDNTGGGMYNDSSSPTITNCAFVRNSAVRGGGMYNLGSNPTVNNCTLSDNAASRGGGMCNEYDSSPIVMNCVFSSNSALFSGGGMDNWESSPTVTNCTFSGNSASYYGGGMCNEYDSSPTVSNCILWGNTASDSGNEIYNGSCTPVIRHCDIKWCGGSGAYWNSNLGTDGGGNIDADPMFVDADSGNLRLQTVSPCIDAGDPSYVSVPGETDLNGNRRVMNGRIDMGAYESIIIANAGQDQIKIDDDGNGSEEVTLDGSASTDSDVDIVSWVWTDALGVIISDNEIFTVTLPLGAHTFTLTVTDDSGLAYSDTVVITVRPPAPIWYVDDSAVGADDGSSWEDAYNHLHDALDTAIFYDNIRVAQGTYLPDTMDRSGPGRGRRPLPLANPREASFKLKNGVTVKGGYAGYGAIDPNERNVELYETILSGDLRGDDDPAALSYDPWSHLSYNPSLEDNCYHVFYHPDESGLDATAVLDGFTIIAGNANGDHPHDSGGGMYNGDYCNLTVTDCMFSDNLAEYGGGMYNGDSSSVQMYNCTFEGNVAGNFGGGMYNGDSSSVQMYQCTFEKNTGINSGGGMYNGNSSSPTVVGCTFTENSSRGFHYYGYGGGIYSGDYCSLTVTNCTFSDNSAHFGGGMFNYEHSNPAISDCIFSGNSAGIGGGMYNNYNNPTVANCKFSNNSARQGGGIDNWYATLVLNNCIFSGNLAINNGGGMANSMHSDSIVTNCTFSGNSANLGGGGMYNELDSSPTLTNCILWGNIAVSDDEICNDSGNPIISYSDISGCLSGGVWDGSLGTDGGDNIDVDPMFVDPAGDYHLLPDSPCLVAGDPSYVPVPGETDLDGNLRVINFRIDMGAYEYTGFANSRPIANPGPDREVTDSGNNGFELVTLDGSGSYDPGGTITNWMWTDALGVIISDNEIVTVTLPLGVHTFTLTVTDDSGLAYSDMVVITVQPHPSKIWYVDDDAIGDPAPGDPSISDPDEDGSVEHPFDAIQKAINSAANGNTIIVLDGTYTGTGNRDIDFLGKAIKVVSESGPENCIIDCEGTESDFHRGFYFHSGEDAYSVLDGFTIINGYVSGDGGAIYFNLSSPTLANCRLKNNRAKRYGGSIYASESESLISNCIISFNECESSSGGGACLFLSDITFSNCVISGNIAPYGGGGIYLGGSNPIIIDCIFADNSAYQSYGEGGAIRCWVSNPVIINSCFVGNFAGGNGGGISCDYESRPTITQCTISGNVAADGGGGIHIAASYPYIMSSIVYGNQALNGNELYVTDWNGHIWPSRCTISHSNIKSDQNDIYVHHGTINWQEGNIDVNPMFVRNPDDGGDGWGDDPDTDGVDEGANDDYGDLRLQAGSLCIDAGDSSVVTVATDLDGNARISGAAVDMGAYEFVPNTAPVADAGADQLVYAGADGLATVQLDGSGSSDADGDELEYFWFEDANEIATGVDPNVVLAAGVHVIELIVDDGTVSSEPNSVTVTVIEAMEARAYVFPRVLNAASRGRYVIARMELPDGVSKDDIANDSLVLIIGDTVIESVRQRRISSRGQDYVFGFFDRGAVIAQAEPEPESEPEAKGKGNGNGNGNGNGKSELDIIIAGELVTGQCIYGEDSIKIVKSQASQKKTLRRMPVRNSRGGRGSRGRK